MRTFNGWRIWRDRVRGGPYDTHTAMTHPLASGRIYSAAGDGYYESIDAADSWSSPHDGLQHRYLVGVAVDPADPDTVIVSATDGPGSAYSPRGPRGTCIGRLGSEMGTVCRTSALTPWRPMNLLASKRRPLLRTSSPLKPRINRELTIAIGTANGGTSALP